MSRRHRTQRLKLNKSGKSHISKSELLNFTRPLFNFSFVSNSNHFNLKYAKKHRNYGKLLMQKLCYLSQFNDLTSCIALPKEIGIEPLPDSEINIRVRSQFRYSKRWSLCDPKYYSFRIKTHSKGEPYRVIGKIWQRKNIFYILAFDPTHRAYKG